MTLRDTIPCPTVGAPTLHHALAALLAETRRRVLEGVRSPATLTMQQAHAVWLEAQLGAELELAELGEAALEALAERARERGGAGGRPLALRTVEKRFSTLRRALKVARRRGWLERVPLMPEFTFGPRVPRPAVFRTGADYKRLLAALPVHRAEWVALCFCTCQHSSDVERMTWADVDLGGEPWMVVRNTKNRRPPLRVRMPGPLVEVLRARRARLEAAGRPPAPTDRLVEAWPTRALTLARASLRVGIPAVTATLLRHAGVSAMVRRLGITPGAQRWGGWLSTQMMEQVYAHALPAQLEELADELATFVDGEEGDR